MTMPAGPEPDGWELLRALEEAKADLLREFNELREMVEHDFVPGTAVTEEFQAVKDRLDAIEEKFITRESSEQHDQLLADRINANTEAIKADQALLMKRVQDIEGDRQTASQTRRTVLLAVVTSFIAAFASVIVTLIHVYG